MRMPNCLLLSLSVRHSCGFLLGSPFPQTRGLIASFSSRLQTRDVSIAAVTTAPDEASSVRAVRLQGTGGLKLLPAVAPANEIAARARNLVSIFIIILSFPSSLPPSSNETPRHSKLKQMTQSEMVEPKQER